MIKLVSNAQMKDWSRELLDAIFRVSLETPSAVCSNIAVICEPDKIDGLQVSDCEFSAPTKPGWHSSIREPIFTHLSNWPSGILRWADLSGDSGRWTNENSGAQQYQHGSAEARSQER